LLVLFFVLTFAITWGLAALVLLFPAPIEALFGDFSTANPVFILAVAGPTVSATALTLAREGWSGLGALYGRLARWRFGIQWYALALVGVPLAGLIVRRVAGPVPQPDLSTPALLFSTLLNLLITGPLGEELGWRGFALPRLLKRLRPLPASLILGGVWGVWHLPSFFVSDLPQSSLSIPIFLLGALCMSILATWLFRHTGGSVLITVSFHYMVNFSFSVLGAPLPAFTLVMAVVAALVVGLDRGLGWFRPAGPSSQFSIR
jgi:membrane protease YdiL (CAAX protease family)